MYVESADDVLINAPQPEEDSVLSANIHYAVDSAQPLERPRREVRTPKYLDGYVRPVAAQLLERARERRVVLQRAVIYTRSVKKKPLQRKIMHFYC